ncbi:histone acetyltransferase MCC1-like [Impatiens glandulifera]|uniref:histone acetyltransferase MCC1-like n=1 Tax=Impatiens glandulifera TaxID=253017 RepID=UPI001FB13CAE|nr:histone acetyltransferase MCC1-like [Impatiens glandulifera]
MWRHMGGSQGLYSPAISYRPIQPSDLDVLMRLHTDLFPVRYEPEFYQKVVTGQELSWGAVDRNRPNGQNDELIGFVTARILPAKDSEVEDLLSCNMSKNDLKLIYILTLGVVESYRNHGIAVSLIKEVKKYAATIPTCRGVYLHVILYNNPAIHLYQKMSFQCVRRLYSFYFINGQHFDAFLFIYYVNGGRSPCSLLDIMRHVMTYLKGGIEVVISKLQRNENKGSRWHKNRETFNLVSTTQNKKILLNDDSGYQCV